MTVSPVPPPVPPAFRGRRAVTVAAWLALMGGALVTLHAAGGVLSGPPLGTPSRWPRWTAGRDPVVIAFGVVRLLALAAGWYGLIVTVAGVVLRLASAHRLSSVVDRVTVGPLRRLVAATVAVGVSAGPLTAAGASSLATTTSVPVSPPASADIGPPVTVTMHLVAPGGDPPPTTVVPAPAPGSPPQVSVPVAPPRSQASAEAPLATWTVEPGQCFWSIADVVLAQAWGRPPTEAEIVPYWRMLIEANRAELSDPHNPDLVFPGQVFSLPEV